MTQADSWKTRPNPIIWIFFQNERKSDGESGRFLENSSKQFFDLYCKVRQKKSNVMTIRGNRVGVKVDGPQRGRWIVPNVDGQAESGWSFDEKWTVQAKVNGPNVGKSPRSNVDGPKILIVDCPSETHRHTVTENPISTPLLSYFHDESFTSTRSHRISMDEFSMKRSDSRLDFFP